MTYISEIIIQGFQIHEDTHIHLSPNLNVIIGETDQGKSSIFRAIRWVARNLPNTDSYINSNTKKALVVLVLSNGFKVERYRDSKENLYRIYKDDELLHELKAARGSVPDKVSEVLNMTDLNFEKQFSMPFMISESGGEVARMWNKVSGMDLADIMKKNLKLSLKEVNKDLENTSSQIQSEIDIQNNLKPVEKARVFFNEADKINNKINTLVEECSSMESLIEKTEELQDSFDHHSILKKKLENNVDHILTIEHKIKEEKDKIDKITDTCERIDLIEWEIETYSEILEIQGIDDINEIIKKINKEESELEKLESVTKKINSIMTDIEYEENEVESYENQIEEMKEDITECPLCGGEV